MFGLHPFLDVATGSIRRGFLVGLNLGLSIQVVAEMLQQGDLFLQFSLRRETAEFVRREDICFVALLLLDVFEVLAVFVHYDLCGVVEVDAC